MPVGRFSGAPTSLEAVALAVLAVTAGSFWLPLVLALALVDGTLAAVARATTRAATVALLEPVGQAARGERGAQRRVLRHERWRGRSPPVRSSRCSARRGPRRSRRRCSLLLAVLDRGRAGSARRASRSRRVWRARLREGLDYVRGDPTLRTLLFGQAFVLVLLTMVTPIEIVYAKESLDAGDVGLGALLDRVGRWHGHRERPLRSRASALDAPADRRLDVRHAASATSAWRARRSSSARAHVGAGRHRQRRAVGVGRHGAAGGDRRALPGACRGLLEAVSWPPAGHRLPARRDDHRAAVAARGVRRRGRRRDRCRCSSPARSSRARRRCRAAAGARAGPGAA